MAYGNVNAPGVTLSEMLTEINGDLNDVKYLGHKSFGVMGTSTAKTIKNCQTVVAFLPDSFTCGGNDAVPNGANDYTYQRIIDIHGNIWGRNSFRNGLSARSFGEWKLIPMSGQYIPTGQKGVASLDAMGICGLPMFEEVG